MRSEQSKHELKVLQLGAGPTAFSALQSLAEQFDVVGLVRECPPGPAVEDEAARLAHTLDVPVLTDASFGAIGRYLEDLRPDCVVVSSYRRILPPKLLAMGKFVNVHYAPLPRYRGRASVNWAIINGESFTGITIHAIEPALDDGNILYQETVEISESDDVASLYERLNSIQRKVLAKTVRSFLNGYAGIPQERQKASYGCTRTPDDGEIDWTNSAADIHRLVRALVAPFPGAFTFHKGKRILVLRAEIVADPPPLEGRLPGRVLAVSKRGGFVDVIAGEGILRITEVQREGRGVEPAPQVIQSVSDTLGIRTSELLARIDRLEQLLASQGAPKSGSPYIV